MYQLVRPFGGTPPRWRGGPGLVRGVLPGARNTPASARGTIRRTPRPGPAPEHPRVGGEEGTEGARCAPTAEHPRVGGEDLIEIMTGSPVYGTPPRRRGGPRAVDDGVGVRRNTPRRRGGYRVDSLAHAGQRSTPASAGRTWRTAWRRRCTAEHPRVGGENYWVRPPDSAVSGAPPRRRGEPRTIQDDRAEGRNTPTSAERTPWPSCAAPRRTEHPRVGGEDTVFSDTTTAPGRTPPCRRGGLVEVAPGYERFRNTPASAGKTTATRSAPAVDRITPATAGKRRGVRPALAGRRITPASAGRTSVIRSMRRQASEHPRVGGEDRRQAPSPLGTTGTPPRRRGGPRPALPVRR